ncbi:hypothetical protein KR093_000807 [Drosophila rubida]|uniref:Transcription factor IIIC 90kDa subunit N-terminal domain-containing protein n=1 Tax=Drosophila rubida TaxID=30044 RepID=A0AAD4JWV5_9MUSC|nr:hypothetical protein KR093_000807 [Drosophila rubida]
MKFQQIAKDDLRQDNARDFICHTADGNCIALIGSKTDLTTLELINKVSYQMSLPYLVANFECSPRARPLDKLVQQVNVQHIYNKCNALEVQQLSLDPCYAGISPQEVADATLLAAKWSPQLLPNGNMLLAFLNSYGSLELVSKKPQHSFWHHYEQYDISATFRDELQPPFEVAPDKIDTFRRYQAFIDRSWITMFAWRSLKSDNGNHVLILGTAVGSLWTLNLSGDAQTVQAFCELHTLLDRICYMHVFDDLLLVGDISGLVHLYRFNESAEGGMELVKPLWLRPDQMSLQQAVVTHCAERKCYYIACCKGAHLLIWCMPQGAGADNWLETRFLVGGIKISSICSIDNCSYALATARGPFYRIEVHHKAAQLSVSKQLIEVDDAENLKAVGMFSSPKKNLLTVLFVRNKEYLIDNKTQRRELTICVGKLGKSDSLARLSELLPANEPINSYKDLLSDVRLQIYNRIDIEKFAKFASCESIDFHELATQAQLQQLQLKYHVLDALHHVQQYQSSDYCELEMQLLLAMLAITHIRLRLQYLSELANRTPFQTKATQCQLQEIVRIKQQLEQSLQKEQPINASIKRFLDFVDVHFNALQQKLGRPPVLDVKQEPKRCCISYMELLPELETHYCTICGRQALMEQQLLLELYEPGSCLICPYCHGAFAMELCDA